MWIFLKSTALPLKREKRARSLNLFILSACVLRLEKKHSRKRIFYVHNNNDSYNMQCKCFGFPYGKNLVYNIYSYIQ